MASSVARYAATIASTLASVVPAARLRIFPAWIAGPSAIGSVNGMPSSTMSAPPATTAVKTCALRSRSGSPAVTKVTSAARSCAAHAANRRARRSVTGPNPKASATVKMSLSPRPHRFATISVVARHRRCHPLDRRDRVGGFQRGDDPFEAAQPLERRQRLGIGRRLILDPPDRVEPRMFGADPRIVEPRRDRVRLGDLAIGVLEEHRLVAVEHAGDAPREARRVLLRVEAVPRRLDPDHPHVVVEEGVEQPDRVRIRRRSRRRGYRGDALRPRRSARAPRAR